LNSGTLGVEYEESAKIKDAKRFNMLLPEKHGMTDVSLFGNIDHRLVELWVDYHQRT
jgi:hypothetical protein